MCPLLGSWDDRLACCPSPRPWGVHANVGGRPRVHGAHRQVAAALPLRRHESLAVRGDRECHDGRGSGSVRALLVADNVPWPPLGGGLVRLAQVVEAVASVSDLDLFVLHNLNRSTVEVPSTIPVVRSKGVQNPRTSGHLRWRLEWAVRRGLPAEVVMARADRTPRTALRDWARPPYDVVWFSTARSYEWLDRPDFGPTIVDLDNLEDVKARLRAELLAEELRSIPVRRSLSSRLAWYQARLNGSDWRRFQRSVAAQVERVVIASDLDAARSGLPNVTVIPNTYPRPKRPVGNPAADRPPVVLFQGNLGYPPNIDAAQWLATAIAPLIRAKVPSAEIRLVGRPGSNVVQLHQPGTVTVVGEVPSMDDELSRATVALVPVRYGSGTRIKILESFAHRIPVVSTTLGAEGLDVEDGVHLLLADDPNALAAAAARLLGDAGLRVRLTEAAEDRYLERYDGRLADQGVRRLVEDVAGASTRS
jgi:glycosyltransferase involved in cell wall biosynthesis